LEKQEKMAKKSLIDEIGYLKKQIENL